MIKMRTMILLWCALGPVANGFLALQPILHHTKTSVTILKSKRDNDSDEHAVTAFPVGSFVEFEEKKRIHIGKIESVQYKSGGGTPRYQIIDAQGKKWNDVADKAVLYNMACPNSPNQAERLFEEFCRSQDIPIASLQEQLDITPNLLEMAWEDVVQNDENNNNNESSSDLLLTPSSLIELVQGHTASAMEKYLVWKLLQTEMAHVFFREIKIHGRVVAFKAKTRKAVEAAKVTFCQKMQYNHDDNEICFV